MFVYRARLGDGAETLLSVAVRRRPVDHCLGAPTPRGRFRITIRFAASGGAVHTHQGELLADVPEGVTLATASCQMADGEALLTFRPVPPAGRTVRERIITDRFRLPFRFQSSGVIATDVTVGRVRLLCRACDGGGLAIRGHVLLRVDAATGVIRAPIPFVRLLAIDAEPELRWKAMADVAGLRLRAGPDGTTEGELALALRCEGRHPIRQVGAPPDVAHVRDITGRIARASADAVGAGHAIVSGALELDVYWVDGQGTSRWTGRSVPFSAFLDLPGAEEGAVLEPAVRIERLAQVGGEVHLLLEASVTALQAESVTLGAGCYRMERVVGSAATSISLVEPLWAERRRAPTRGTATVVPPTTTPGQAESESILPLPGPITGVEAVTITNKHATAILRMPGHSYWHTITAAPFRLPATAGRIVSATACPVVIDGDWHLRLIVTRNTGQ